MREHFKNSNILEHKDSISEDSADNQDENYYNTGEYLEDTVKEGSLHQISLKSKTN